MTSGRFDFVLNGAAVQVSGVAPQTTLLDYVRSRGLTGAKEGCAEGECGACAVLLVGEGPHGTRFQPVNSCLIPLPASAGQEIYTVEALAHSGRLAEVQRAMIDLGGSQCGYCTAGFIVSMFAEHYRRENRLADTESLGGNLCRCTGYRPIRDALMSLGPPAADTFFAQRLKEAVPPASPVRYENSYGRFSRPCTLEQCFHLIRSDESAQFVAGNTDLGLMTNLRDQRFPHLISLEGIPEIRLLQNEPNFVEIGAGLTLTEMEERWKDPPPVFREWLRLFASVLIRNRATLGGNLATASPIGDSAPMLMALDAELVIACAEGERIIPLHEFFEAYRRTVLRRDEVIRSVRIPKPFPTHARFFKIAKRSMDDISTVAAGISVHMNAQGQIAKQRFAFGGVAAVPMRAVAAEQETEPERVKEALAATLNPIGDHRGSAKYRLAMAQSVIEKFWYEL